MSFFQTVLAVLLNNKIVTLLSLFTFVFFVCTVALGAQNSKLRGELEISRELANKPCPDQSSSTVPSTTANNTTKHLKPTMAPETPNKWRLPQGLFVPLEYDLTLRPNLQDGTYSGVVKILFNVKEKLAFVKINSKGLNINAVEVNKRFISGSLTNDENEIITIKLNPNMEQLKPGENNSLDIKFNGDMKNRIVGLYRSSYVGEDGKER